MHEPPGNRGYRIKLLFDLWKNRYGFGYRNLNRPEKISIPIIVEVQTQFETFRDHLFDFSANWTLNTKHRTVQPADTNPIFVQKLILVRVLQIEIPIYLSFEQIFKFDWRILMWWNHFFIFLLYEKVNIVIKHMNTFGSWVSIRNKLLDFMLPFCSSHISVTGSCLVS